MTRDHIILTLSLWGFLAQAGFGQGVEPPGWDGVMRVFEKRCLNCHSKHGAPKGLRLDSYEATVAGGRDGPVVLPGNAKESELVMRLRGESVPRMPFLDRPLPEEEIDLIVRWIDAGLPNTLAPD